MNSAEFKDQIARLEKEWPNLFGEEKLKILWAKYKDARLDWFSSVVTYILCYWRKRPIPADFAEADRMMMKDAAIKREREWAEEKQVFAQEAHDFVEGLDSQLDSDQMKKDIKELFGRN